LKVFISFDMEGVGGVSSWRETARGGKEFNRVRELATQEINAVVEGIKQSGEKLEEILVADSHSFGENLLIEELDEEVSLVKGYPRTYYMMEGLDSSFDLLFFVGYHAGVGTQGGGMDHTYSPSTIYELRVGGKPMGEAEINAAYAGHFGVPLGLASGDDRFVEQVRMSFDERVETVVTKYGVSRFASRNIHPLRVRELLREAAQAAVKKARSLKPYCISPPLEVEIDLVTTLIGDLASLIPGVERLSGRQIRFHPQDLPALYRTLMLIATLGTLAKQIE